MGTDAGDTDRGEPSYPDGVPNFKKLGFIPLGVAGSRPMANANDAIQVVSGLLNRPSRYVDDNGYEQETTAAAVHPNGRWVAWVEYRCKVRPTGYVDIEFRLKAQVDHRTVIDWAVETYNPYFGCRVGYLAWHGERVVAVYREKHHTYACSLAAEGTKALVRIADQWTAVGDQITFRSDEPDLVERLALPDLRRLDPISATEARRAGILPSDYDHWNEWNKKHSSKKPQKKGEE